MIRLKAFGCNGSNKGNGYIEVRRSSCKRPGNMKKGDRRKRMKEDVGDIGEREKGVL